MKPEDKGKSWKDVKKVELGMTESQRQGKLKMAHQAPGKRAQGQRQTEISE